MRSVNRFAFAWLPLLLIAGCSTQKSSAPSENPPELALLIREGLQAEARGDASAARAAYERGTRDFADHSAPWALLGEYHRFWGHDADAAWRQFRRAVEAPVRNSYWIAFALRGQGEVARARGSIGKAIALFEESIEKKPIAEAHRSLSALYANELRDFDKAALHAKAAVDLSPDDPIALLQYAVQMVRFKKAREAGEAFAKAIRLAGCDVNGRSDSHVHCCVLYNGACYHAVRGDKAAALAMLKEFFITPNHRHITREEILRDPDFESLAKDPEFQALLEYRLPVE